MATLNDSKSKPSSRKKMGFLATLVLYFFALCGLLSILQHMAPRQLRGNPTSVSSSSLVSVTVERKSPVVESTPTAPVASNTVASTVTNTCPIFTADGRPLLESLAYKFGTDKSRNDHDYVSVYASLFDQIRCQVNVVVEVGIAAGQSLQMWHEYFPKAQVHGFDLVPTKRMQRIVDHYPRVHYYAQDLLQPQVQLPSGVAVGGVDIVIEDAMHTPEQQEAFLLALFPLIKPGGYYVIEDIHNQNDVGSKFAEHPELLQPATRQLLYENHAFYVDSHVGHHDWDAYVKLLGPDWASSHAQHNSHLLVIRKRVGPVPPVQVNFGTVAMHFDKVVMDDNNGPSPKYNNNNNNHNSKNKSVRRGNYNNGVRQAKNNGVRRSRNNGAI